MSAPARPKPAPQVHGLTLPPGETLTINSPNGGALTLTNPSSKVGSLVIASGGRTRRITLPPFVARKCAFARATVILANLGPAGVRVDVRVRAQKAARQKTASESPGFYFYPSWQLSFNLPQRGSVHLANGSAQKGEVAVTQDGETETRSLPAGGDTSFQMKPGEAKVANSGKVRLSLSITEAR